MSEDGEDPFDRFEDAADREGDPFDRLDAGGNGDGHSTAPVSDRDPADGVGDTAGEDGDVPEHDPFPEQDGRGDPFESGESVFERMDVEEIDPDSVWEQLTATRERGSVADVEGRTYAEVSKHSFCERCQYVSDPPEISCSHEGTEILEFLAMDTVRVVDCPVVAERRNLEEQG